MALSGKESVEILVIIVGRPNVMLTSLQPLANIKECSHTSLRI